MPISQYASFAAGGGANTMSYTAWSALTTLIANGFQTGTASSEQMNTLLRQLSTAAAGTAGFAATYGLNDVNDDGNATNFRNAIKSAIDQLIAAQQFWKAGDIKASLVNTTPPGWLKANGAIVSRTTYAALFAAIGTKYGSGNGSTTFQLPDLRAEFLRGWDDGRGVDNARTLGSLQAQMVLQHIHRMPVGINLEPPAGFTRGTTANKPGISGPDNDNWFWDTNDGTNIDGTVNSAGVIGSENRPRNISVLYLIKT